MDKEELKEEIVKLLEEWWDGGSKKGSPVVGNKTFELMADAALAVLFAVEEVQYFLETY